MPVEFHRRSVLALAAVSIAPTAWSQASPESTLAQIKQRGALRVGVTQAPPWYSKDPKSGDWASGVGVSLGKAMAASLGVKASSSATASGRGCAWCRAASSASTRTSTVSTKARPRSRSTSA